MAFTLRNFAALSRRNAAAPLSAARFVQRASYQTSAVRFAGKESALNHDGRAEEVELQKQDLLKKQEEGKGHWKDELASDSESIIKADRGEIDASADTIKQLQEESVKLAEKTHQSSGDEAKTDLK
ncbi:hypothetical protein W97_00432 [Coniosporium apollinis CBS 100218]|uniref:Uncharacterized protein n=1 Tax=Coniosporium apollinis (strain CBS 100218) TaxID=1168221 RepID=R7YHE6_CONA1|nr:uncharacterized protein W97_00432 [Coniosporium apollinis CBS 100218]EON61219.1 hypothetical protein W97_00432 [Coniosporium apollinis CBS 100218]